MITVAFTVPVVFERSVMRGQPPIETSPRPSATGSLHSVIDVVLVAGEFDVVLVAGEFDVVLVAGEVVTVLELAALFAHTNLVPVFLHTNVTPLIFCV